jgi:transcriptional regulator with XRE-family HTH domain
MRTKLLAKVVGENIAKKRHALGLTQMVLAERLGIGQDALSRMEQGTISPKISRLRDFAVTLECSVPALFREKDDDVDVYLAELGELLLCLEPRKREAATRVMREIVKIAK